MDTLQWIKEVAPIVEALAVVIGVGWGLKLAKQAIQTKEATIQQKEATIELLEKFRSGPLAAELEMVTKVLNKYIGEKKQLEGQLQSVGEKTERQRRVVAGAVFIEAYLAIQELRIAYQSAAGGFDALSLPSKMNSVAEEFFKQGERAFAGQEIDVPRVKQALAARNS